MKASKMSDTKFMAHVKAIMKQENVKEEKARMMAFFEGEKKGQERIKQEESR